MEQKPKTMSLEDQILAFVSCYKDGKWSTPLDTQILSFFVCNEKGQNPKIEEVEEILKKLQENNQVKVLTEYANIDSLGNRYGPATA